MFVDRHWMSVDGGHAGVELADGVVYLAMPVRNVGNGIAVIEILGLPFAGQLTVGDVGIEVEHFRPQTRSLWIPPGDVGFWQAALRDETEEIFGVIAEAIGEGAVTVELLYRDHEGGRTVTRFSLSATTETPVGGSRCPATRRSTTLFMHAVADRCGRTRPVAPTGRRQYRSAGS